MYSSSLYFVRSSLILHDEFDSANLMKVEAKDVAFIMVGVIMIQALVLLCWQFIDPMKWEREVSDDVVPCIISSLQQKLKHTLGVFPIV